MDKWLMTPDEIEQAFEATLHAEANRKHDIVIAQPTEIRIGCPCLSCGAVTDPYGNLPCGH